MIFRSKFDLNCRIGPLFIYFKATRLGLKSSIRHQFAIYPYLRFCLFGKLLLIRQVIVEYQVGSSYLLKFGYHVAG